MIVPRLKRYVICIRSISLEVAVIRRAVPERIFALFRKCRVGEASLYLWPILGRFRGRREIPCVDRKLGRYSVEAE